MRVNANPDEVRKFILRTALFQRLLILDNPPLGTGFDARVNARVKLMPAKHRVCKQGFGESSFVGKDIVSPEGVAILENGHDYGPASENLSKLSVYAHVFILYPSH